MKEKVLLLELPEGNKCLKVIITDDGITGRISLEDLCNQKDKVEIPKPEALVGGSEVYQNDDVPYWYCKIKDGRDTFMHVYMEDLTEKDLLYDAKTGKKREFRTYGQKEFKKNVLKALADKPKEGFRWIPMYEPSLAPNGSMQFVAGEKPLVGEYIEWSELLENYSPQNECQVSTKTTYFLLLLRWLKDGIATLEQLADKSKDIGHFFDTKLENTGERKFGGLYGFVGNTYKVVETTNLSYPWKSQCCLGGCFSDCVANVSVSHVIDIEERDCQDYLG